MRYITIATHGIIKKIENLELKLSILFFTIFEGYIEATM